MTDSEASRYFGRMWHTAVRRRFRRAGRRYRETRMVSRAIKSGAHPVAVHLVVTCRCNLSCSYCNEFNDHSAPVPIDLLEKRVAHLAALRCAVITLSGGEPLLHPDLEHLIRTIRSHGIIATILTNGTLLTEPRIVSLNRAGLDRLQISGDASGLQVLPIPVRILRWMFLTGTCYRTLRRVALRLLE